MKPIRRDIINPRGDSLTFTVKVPLDSTPDIRFSIKKNKTDRSYILQKTIGDGIRDETEETDDVRWFTVNVAPSDTNDVMPGDYYYDLQVKLDGEVLTPIEGLFKITFDISREV